MPLNTIRPMGPTATATEPLLAQRQAFRNQMMDPNSGRYDIMRDVFGMNGREAQARRNTNWNHESNLSVLKSPNRRPELLDVNRGPVERTPYVPPTRLSTNFQPQDNAQKFNAPDPGPLPSPTGLVNPGTNAFPNNQPVAPRPNHLPEVPPRIVPRTPGAYPTLQNRGPIPRPTGYRQFDV
jgi:hypothetical protein